MKHILIIALLLLPNPCLGAYQDNFTSKVNTVLSPNIALVSAVIIQKNPKRIGAILWNNSANSVYINYGATGDSANNMTVIIPSFASWVMPAPIYTGVISGKRNAGTGFVTVTELVQEN